MICGEGVPCPRIEEVEEDGEARAICVDADAEDGTDDEDKEEFG